MPSRSARASTALPKTTSCAPTPRLATTIWPVGPRRRAVGQPAADRAVERAPAGEVHAAVAVELRDVVAQRAARRAFAVSAGIEVE